MVLKRKIGEWAKRYLPAEVISTAVTILCTWTIHKQGGSNLAVALVGTWAGNITYFGCILVGDIFRSVSAHKKQGTKYNAASGAINLRSLLIEFGFAEAMDNLLTRPLIMYCIPPLMTDFALGILTAKLLADVVFYIPAIVGYELNKKLLKKSS